MSPVLPSIDWRHTQAPASNVARNTRNSKVDAGEVEPWRNRGPKACAVLLALRVEVTDEAARGDLRCEGPVDHSDDLPYTGRSRRR